MTGRGTLKRMGTLVVSAVVGASGLLSLASCDERKKKHVVLHFTGTGNCLYVARREFLKRLGLGTAATTIVFAGYDTKNPMVGSRTARGDVPADKMTYRVNPKSGEKISVLGYGCMRWPMKSAADGKDEVIDQDVVNELVDYAPVCVRRTIASDAASVRNIVRRVSTYLRRCNG